MSLVDAPKLAASLQSLAGWACALMWPIRCLGCGQTAHEHLCLTCISCCARHTGSRCRRCDDLSATPLCSRCRARGPHGLEAARGVWRYGGPIKQAVRAGKHDGHEGAFAPLARTIAADPEAARLGALCQALVPIPLSARRRFGRGYNPSALLARALGEAWHKPVRHLLRSCAGLTQAPLSRLDAQQRLALTGQRFAPVCARSQYAGLTLLLVDDVITTGATLAAAARQLRAQGAHRVFAVALARQTLEHGI